MGIKRGHEKSEEEEPQKNNITEAEAALYDRQIRLWGLESQQRLRNTKVLLIGVGGLGSEVIKNITLAGVKSITLLDDKRVQENDYASQFFLHGVEIGKSRAEESKARVKQLNPNVEIISDDGSVSEKSDDYFKDFDVVCATDCDPADLVRLNKLCRENKIHFYCGDVWGYHGYCFIDLGTFTYLHTKNSKGEPVQKKMKPDSQLMTAKFGSLERALSFKSGKIGAGLPKKISKVFFLVHLLMKFREKHKRLPMPQSHEEDMESLSALRKPVMEKIGFSEDRITDTDLKNLFGEISPVCAVVGGVLAQEIIKAVCANGDPLQNFFLFDGDECLGVVESIG